MQLFRLFGTKMRAFIIITFCAVYSVHAWTQDFNSIHIDTKTGQIPSKYYPLSSDDQRATRKAATFVNFIKVVPQLNPLKLPTMGPYNVVLPSLNFQGELNLDRVSVWGIKQVNVPNIELRMAPTRLDFNLSLPQAAAEAHFNLRATLNNKPINVNGIASASLYQLELGAAVAPKIAQDGANQVYKVEDADVNIDLNEIQVTVQMNKYSEEVKALLTQVLNAPSQHPNEINDILRAVLQGISQELTQITAEEILQYLFGSARPAVASRHGRYLRYNNNYYNRN